MQHMQRKRKRRNLVSVTYMCLLHVQDVEKDLLTLSVESKSEKTDKKKEDGVTWHHTERSSSFMKRCIRMPETADLDNVKASYQDGTLHVEVPKKEVAKSNKRINIA